MRDRLIWLIKNAEKAFPKDKPVLDIEEFVADFLLTNGVVVPPCKVGEKVFAVIWAHSLGKKCVTPYIVDELFYSTKRGVRPWVVICFGGKRFDNADFGKTVFLTREEAERALKGGEADA